MTDLAPLDREGEIAKVTLNQPAELNALNDRMWTRLHEIFRARADRACAA